MKVSSWQIFLFCCCNGSGHWSVSHGWNMCQHRSANWTAKLRRRVHDSPEGSKKPVANADRIFAMMLCCSSPCYLNVGLIGSCVRGRRIQRFQCPYPAVRLRAYLIVLVLLLIQFFFRYSIQKPGTGITHTACVPSWHRNLGIFQSFTRFKVYTCYRTNQVLWGWAKLS